MKRILLPTLLILTLFLVSGNASAPTQDRYCGDMICEQYTIALMGNDQAPFKLYGIEHTVQLLGFSQNYTKANIAIDGESAEVEEGNWYTIKEVPVRVDYIDEIYLGPSYYEMGIHLTLGESYESCPADCGQGMCYDSDYGKDYYTYGVVSWENGTSQDYCIDGYLLKEYYCYQGVKSLEYSCPNGCTNGACIEVTGCTDSDGGKNYYTKGETQVTGQYSGGEPGVDFCAYLLPEEPGNKYHFYETYECEGITCEVVEHFCDGGNPFNIAKTCPSGCRDGACLDMGFTFTGNCYDPDGENYYLRSAAYEKTESGIVGLSDKCSNCYQVDSYTGECVREIYCNNGVLSKKTYTCPNGCTNGACIEVTGCTDSDGGLDYYVKGTATDEWHSYTDKCYIYGENYVESCVASEECGISEAYCATPTDALYYVPGGGAGPAFVPCENGCRDGACITGGECNIYLDGTGDEHSVIIEGNTYKFKLKGFEATTPEKVYIYINGNPTSPYGWTEGSTYTITGTAINVLVKSVDIVYIDPQTPYIRVHLFIGKECAEGKICGNGVCEIGETWENCPQDCQAPECPISIDLEFNKYDYYPGDYFEVTVKVYDKHYSLMPNRAFSVYNARQGVSTTFYTDSTGVYRSSSTVPQSDPSYNGKWSFTASVGEQNCPYIFDTETIYLHMEDNCGDGFCDEYEKILICDTIPDTAQTTGAVDDITTYCHVKCPADCTPNCGNGICDTVVCEALGCPVPENEQNCPSDCREPTYCGSQSSDPRCICPEGYIKDVFEAPCQDLPVENAYTGTATQTAIQSTGFTQLGVPEEWGLGTDGIFKLVLRNDLAQEVNVKRITAEFSVGSFRLTTIFYTQNCRSNEIYMTIPPGGTVDAHTYCTNLDYNLIYPGAAAGVTYSVKLQILYNAGGYDRTDEGTLTGTVYSAGGICTDSDGGKNYYVRGIASGNYQGSYIRNSDNCLSDPTQRNVVSSSPYLGELYCEDDYNLNFEVYTCPRGCVEGVCMQELMCTYYRCIPAYKYLHLYTDKYAYGINEPVQIYTNQFESGDMQLENIGVSVINPYGTRSAVTMVPVCDIGECPPCQPGYYCPPCDTYTTCRYEGTFTGTGAVGTYRVEQLSEEENVVIRPTSFRVYDYSLLAKYLILGNIDSYIYKESQLYPVPSPENITGYFAVYEKDGTSYGVIVYSFETRDELETLLNQGFQYVTPSEKRIDGYYIYVLDSYGQRAYIWTYKTFLLAVMENLPAHTLQAGEYTSKTPTISSPPPASRPLGEQITAEQPRAADPDFLTGMVTGMPVAGAPQPPYCGMDSMNSQCVCNAGETREEFTPPCAYSPCPTHYRCASPIPEVLIKAYLDKYPSDLKATGTECEQNGGYCTDGPCSPGFEEAEFACKTDYERCCIREVDREDFLEIVMKLEGIRVRMDRLERKSIALAEYYDSTGDEERAAKFREVAGMFAEAKSMVDNIVAKIRANLNNLEAIRNEIRDDVQELRTYIRSILEEMVS